MIKIDAKNLIFDALNEKVRNSEDDFEISFQGQPASPQPLKIESGFSRLKS